MKAFEHMFNSAPVILTGGPILERMKREFQLPVDHYSHSQYDMIQSNPVLLNIIYRYYIEIVKHYDFPLILGAPNPRIKGDSTEEDISEFKNRSKKAFQYTHNIRQEYDSYADNIYIGGTLGCIGDAYSGKQYMTFKEAYEFHVKQVEAFQDIDVDFIYVNIMPEINEILGLAQALSEQSKPYIISFMIRKNGRLLDGTSIVDAIKIVDDWVTHKPLCYMTNCIHPTNLKIALSQDCNADRETLTRFKGLKSNASRLSPEELESSTIIQQEDFNVMVNEMTDLKKEYGLKILGGCCGTNDDFLKLLANQLHRSLDLQYK